MKRKCIQYDASELMQSALMDSGSSPNYLYTLLREYKLKKVIMTLPIEEHPFYVLLIDSVLDNGLNLTIEKMNVLRKMKIYCPLEVFFKFCSCENSMILQENGISDEQVGLLISNAYNCLKDSSDVELKHFTEFEEQEELGILVVLMNHNIIQQSDTIRFVKSCRDGNATELIGLLENKSIAGTIFHDIPLIFQPLIECKGDWVERMEVLLDHGLSVNELYYEWNSTLLVMALYEKEDTVLDETLLCQFTQLVISRGIDIEIKDSAGKTVLLQASSMGRLEVCKMLIDAGANTSDKQQSIVELLFNVKHSDRQVDTILTNNFECQHIWKLAIDNGMDVPFDVLDDLLDCDECKCCFGI